MKTLSISKRLMDVISIVEKFGPDKGEYAILNKAVNDITSKEEVDTLIELVKPMLNEQTMFGHAYSKPFGYAGDFLLIEKMYKKQVSDDPRFRKWDLYYHSQEAAKAVRNRKTYFVKILEELYARKKGEPIEILILGCGPATDVYEFFSRNPKANVKFDLLDIDQRAIDYATQKNKKFLDRISFIRMNVLRFKPNKKYDLVWSAGLFDYLNDRLFTGLVSRYKHFMKEDGEMIIGNFSPYNPRKAQEILCDWYLILRDSDHLTQIALNAGVPIDAVYVDKEPLGINLFLRINAAIVYSSAVEETEKRHARSLEMSCAI